MRETHTATDHPVAEVHTILNTVIDNLCDRIEEAFGVMKGAQNETKVAQLLEMKSCGLLFKGTGVTILESMNRDFVKGLFHPWKLVYASDMSPAGSFCSATVAGLTKFFDEDSCFDGATITKMFPSTSTVSRERIALNSYALEKNGLTRRESQYGEVYYVNKENAICLMLDAAGLTEVARNGPVSIAITSDGANSFRNHTQISLGLKVIDKCGHHCKTKMPLFAAFNEDEDDSSGMFENIQSREMCTILVMADAKDKSVMYPELFAKLYDYAESLRQHGMAASGDDKPYLHPFNITYPSDLKAIWTTSGRGGNCKKTRFFAIYLQQQAMI